MGRFTENNTEEKRLTVKQLSLQPRMVARFAEVLGEAKAHQFMASVVSAVNNNAQLAQCDPTKVMGCAMIAASLNLDINPNLGFSAIVPYAKKYKDDNGKWHTEQIPQFQMMWRGFIQLAIRTGQYKSMNATEVYKDEFDGYDPFKGEIRYHLVTNGDRDNKRTENIVGYMFSFTLINGFENTTYMSKAEAEAHARRYSKAYQYDLKEGKQTSPWSTLFDQMALKTVVKQALSRYGVLSTQMVTAQTLDQVTTADVLNEEEPTYEYTDKADEVVDVKAEKVEEQKSEESQDEVFNEGDFQ